MYWILPICSTDLTIAGDVFSDGYLNFIYVGRATTYSCSMPTVE